MNSFNWWYIEQALCNKLILIILDLFIIKWLILELTSINLWWKFRKMNTLWLYIRLCRFSTKTVQTSFLLTKDLLFWYSISCARWLELLNALFSNIFLGYLFLNIIGYFLLWRRIPFLLRQTLNTSNLLWLELCNRCCFRLLHFRCHFFRLFWTLFNFKWGILLCLNI